MERLVEWNGNDKKSALPKCINEWGDTVYIEDICIQLATIYDILGDDYDLDRLRELVEACKGLEPSEIEESKLLIATRKDPEKLARMAELVQADKNEQCVILKARCDTCANCVDQKGYHWCKFWGSLCPDDSEFYCKAARPR